jgi:NADH-quinone oxidoreductase subunit J
MIAALAFYAFAAVLIGSAVMVVTSRNPVHSVLFLILAFFNAAGLFLLAGAEFLARFWSLSMSARSRCCSCSSS